MEVRNYKESTSKNSLIAAIALLALAIATGLIFLPLGITCLVGAAYFGYKWYQINYNPVKYLQEIDAKYFSELNEGFKIIDKCIEEWQHINFKVNEFDSKQKYLVA